MNDFRHLALAAVESRVRQDFYFHRVAMKRALESHRLDFYRFFGFPVIEKADAFLADGYWTFESLRLHRSKL